MSSPAAREDTSLRKGREKIDASAPGSQPVTLGELLGGLAGVELSPEPEEISRNTAPSEEPDPGVRFAPTLRLSVQRKGRRGKTVTLLFGLGGTDAALSAFVTDLKKSLGCGASFEGDALCVQGDQRKKLAAFLKARGAEKVDLGR